MTAGHERGRDEVSGPGTVRAFVRRVRAWLRAGRGVECALLFVAAALLAWSAGLASGLAGREPLAVALLCGSLASACWWREHPLELAALAASLDQRLHHQGALVTAFELEERATRRPLGPLEELVRARVLAHLGFGAALRAEVATPLVPLAAPVTAALVLLLVLEGRAATAPGEPDLARLAAGLQESLAAASMENADGAAAPESVREEAQALADLRELGEALARSRADGARDPAEALRRVSELDRRIAALEAGLDAKSALGERLARSRAWLDALRGALRDAFADGLGAGAPGAESVDAGTDLTRASPDGTISASSMDPDGTASAPGSLATLAAPASAMPNARPLGVQAGSFWPREYDGMVERWIELSRAARTERD